MRITRALHTARYANTIRRLLSGALASVPGAICLTLALACGEGPRGMLSVVDHLIVEAPAELLSSSPFGRAEPILEWSVDNGGLDRWAINAGATAGTKDGALELHPDGGRVVLSLALDAPGSPMDQIEGQLGRTSPPVRVNLFWAGEGERFGQDRKLQANPKEIVDGRFRLQLPSPRKLVRRIRITMVGPPGETERSRGRWLRDRRCVCG